MENEGRPTRDQPLGSPAWNERTQSRAIAAQRAISLACEVADCETVDTALAMPAGDSAWEDPLFRRALLTVLLKARRAEKDLAIISRVFGGKT